MPTDLPRKLAVILFADVVGFSSMMRADESSTFVKVRNHLNLFSNEINTHGGRVVKTSGDAIMAEFNTAIHAVQCAITVQESFAEQNQGLSDVEQVQFRIGINLGDVIVEGNDLFGDGVNVASRLEGLAPPGGICIADAVRSSLGNKSGFSYRDMGEQKVKNIADPVRCFEIADSSTEFTEFKVPNKVSSISSENTDFLTSLIVQPFQFTGPSGDYGYLSMGICDGISNALTCFRFFKIVSQEDSPSSTYILSGSLQISGDRIRISPMLSTNEGQKVWADKLDRDLDDVFEIQDEISAIIAGYLGEAIWQERARLLADKDQQHFSAVDWCYHAMALVHHLTDSETKEAEIAAQRAKELAPNAVLPKLIRAWVFYIRYNQRWLEDSESNRKWITKQVEELLRIDSQNADVHRLASRVYVALGRTQESEAHSKRALELNPYDGDVLAMYGITLAQIGRPVEALPWIEKALRINPSPPGYYRQALFSTLYWVGDDSAALDHLNRCEGAILAHYQYVAIALLHRTNNHTDSKSRIIRFRETRPTISLEDASGLYSHFTDKIALRIFLDELKMAGMPDTSAE